MKTQPEKLLDFMHSRGLIRSRELGELGIQRKALTRAVEKGEIVQVGRGIYGVADRQFSANCCLAEVALRAPRAVMCLLTALQFHELTTQAPFEVWLAVDGHAAKPRIDYPPLRIHYFSGEALSEGIEEHAVDGVTVRVTGVAKTVADCFKYRNKIGLDVALEALRDAWDSRRMTADEIWRYAKIDRVANVMIPYLESLA